MKSIRIKPGMKVVGKRSSGVVEFVTDTQVGYYDQDDWLWVESIKDIEVKIEGRNNVLPNVSDSRSNIEGM